MLQLQYYLRADPFYPHLGQLQLGEACVAQIGGIGYGGDHPPGDMPGLVEFIDSLRVPELSHVRCVSTVLSANPDLNPDPDYNLNPDPNMTIIQTPAPTLTLTLTLPVYGVSLPTNIGSVALRP